MAYVNLRMLAPHAHSQAQVHTGTSAAHVLTHGRTFPMVMALSLPRFG